MTYLVLSWFPYTKETEVNVNELESFGDAKKLAGNKKRYGYEVLIVRKEPKANKENKELYSYRLENFGFFKIYMAVSVFLFFLLLSLFFTLLYLYFTK